MGEKDGEVSTKEEKEWVRDGGNFQLEGYLHIGRSWNERFKSWRILKFFASFSDPFQFTISIISLTFTSLILPFLLSVLYLRSPFSSLLIPHIRLSFPSFNVFFNSWHTFYTWSIVYWLSILHAHTFLTLLCWNFCLLVFLPYFVLFMLVVLFLI